MTSTSTLILKGINRYDVLNTLETTYLYFTLDGQLWAALVTQSYEKPRATCGPNCAACSFKFSNEDFVSSGFLISGRELL